VQNDITVLSTTNSKIKEKCESFATRLTLLQEKNQTWHMTVFLEKHSRNELPPT
jgi:hypothetical protein